MGLFVKNVKLYRFSLVQSLVASSSINKWVIQIVSICQFKQCFNRGVKWAGNYCCAIWKAYVIPHIVTQRITNIKPRTRNSAVKKCEISFSMTICTFPEAHLATWKSFASDICIMPWFSTMDFCWSCCTKEAMDVIHFICYAAAVYKKEINMFEIVLSICNMLRTNYATASSQA